MKTRDLKKQLVSESKTFVPDIKDKVYASVGFDSKKKSKLSLRFKPAIVFLGLLLLSLSFFIRPAAIVNSFVIVQINPAFELEVDHKNKIVQANPLNADGYFFLESLNIENANLEDAIDKILNEAIMQGFLQTEESKITAYAVNKNSKIETNVNDIIRKTIEAKKPDAINNNQELREEANKYNVSPGKMLIIKKALQSDSTLTIDVALKMDNKDLIEIINKDARKTVEKFEGQYRENLNELENNYKTAVEDLKARKEKVEERLEYIENLIDNNNSYLVIIGRIAIDFKEFTLDTNVIYDLEKLLEELEDFYDDHFDFLEVVIKENYKNQKDAYKDKVSENSRNNRDDFSFEFHDNYQNGKYNKRYTDDEKEVIRLINRLSVLIKNRHSGANKRILELYEDYLEEIDDLSIEFKNSEIVIQFEQEYEEYMDNKK